MDLETDKVAVLWVGTKAQQQVSLLLSALLLGQEEVELLVKLKLV